MATPTSSKSKAVTQASNFVKAIIQKDLDSRKYQQIGTRFPPEPNGYLHIGHAKSICLNFGLARDFNGTCNLRFDDTNPLTEDTEYVDSIKHDVQWLGFQWSELRFASDYFEQLYQYAVSLIRSGKAYVDSLTDEEIRAYRGTVTEPGKPSPFRGRSTEENLALFEKMRTGEFADGTHVLRAKIDLTSPNMKMRDPLLYRIRHATHHRTGNQWCIYPMYDFAHCLSDAIEGITHSICTLEFENNRELYDWIIAEVNPPAHPHQYEFARLQLTYTILSKRKLLQLVEQGHVSGWDDPRMPTIAGYRRRGYTAEAIRGFCTDIGVAKANSRVDISQLEFKQRDDLNQKAPRVMAVLKPLRVILENYPEDGEELLQAASFPHDVPKEGSRTIPFGKVIYIDRADFMEHPAKKFHRLAPGREVRLRYAYVIKCHGIVRNPENDEIVALRCTYDPETLGVNPSGRKIKGIIHWVPQKQALPAEFRLFDRLFNDPQPDRGEHPFTHYLNPHSLEVIKGFIEPAVAQDPPGSHYQFERLGYYCSDMADSREGALVFNRVVSLRDSWQKIQELSAAPSPPKPAKKEAAKTQKPAHAKPQTLHLPKDPKLMAFYEKAVSHWQLSQAEALVLSSSHLLAQLFQEAVAGQPHTKTIANLIVNELVRELKEHEADSLKFGGTELGLLAALIEAGTISSTGAKEVLAVMFSQGGQPEDIVKNRNLQQVNDQDALMAMAETVLAENAGAVARYQAGKHNLLGFFVGQVMKASKGKANPAAVNKVIRELLAQQPPS